MPPRKHKYSAVATVVDGIRFASKREARRYQELRLLEQAGQISALRRQPVFQLHAEGGGFVGRYFGDFEYTDHATGLVVVEDAKGFDPPLSKWKRRHVKVQYGIDVQIV